MFWIIFLLYQVLYPIAFIISFPAWISKMKKRNGFGTGIVQRFGFKLPFHSLPKNALYIHAVSVGEAKIAFKLISEIPEKSCILAVTTSSGYHVAKAELPPNVHLIYSPIDVLPILQHVFAKLEPRKVVMIDSEIWPNLFLHLKKKDIPLVIANGRLSDNSFKRFTKFKSIIQPLLQSIHAVSVDTELQAQRWKGIGIQQVHAVGSLKFEQHQVDQLELGSQKATKELWAPNQKIILLASTHTGEELWIYKHLEALHKDYAFAICPRHIERTAEIVAEFENENYSVSRLTDTVKSNSVLIINKNGELLKWMAVADLVIIGKSFLKEGGQNPFESMSLGIPTICGPNMQNFEPLISECHEKEALIKLREKEQLSSAVQTILQDENANAIRTTALAEAQEQYGAVQRTINALEL